MSGTFYILNRPASQIPRQAVRPIFRFMVDYTEHGDLMAKFLSLPCTKMFMYGEQNAILSCLDHISSRGVQLDQTPNCGYLPL